ncbi:MAG: alkane 1-monooxygenase [Hyphomicrobiaceae bacterium]|nr:alkane 1-monooxygenase [Hyphomicrobiaceae bacterium]
MSFSLNPQINPNPLLQTKFANTIRYSLMNLFIVFGIWTMGTGGWVMWLGLLLTFVLIGYVEELMGDAGDKESMPPVWYMNLMLWLTLPLLAFATLTCLNTAGEGKDWMDAILRFLGFDPEAARERTDFFVASGGLASLGMYYGLGGVNVAHELVHRLDSKFNMIVGRWLLAFTWDTGFSLEHVYGHHRNVGTEADPATAKRGEYIWAFVPRSIVGQFFAALKIDRDRMARKGIKNRFYNSVFWRGQAMTLVVIAVYTYMMGPFGILISLYSGAIGKVYLEIVNYIEHYGLVRIPGTRVEPRHSWDSYRRLSTGMTYNLPLHSFHHRFATRPFWELQHSEGEAPVLPRGYMPMILTSFFPGPWKKLSEPLLRDWDERLASPDEVAYLKSIGEYRGRQ